MKILFNTLFLTFIFSFALQEIRKSEKEYIKVQDFALLKTKIIEKANSTHTIRCNFREEKHFTMFDDVLVSNGEYLYKELDKVLWTYSEPNQLISFQGKKAFIKKGDLVKAYEKNQNPSFEFINQLLIKAWHGEILKSKDYSMEFYQNEEQYMVRLFPKKEETIDHFNSIELYFSLIDYGLNGLKINEYNIDYSIIEFRNRILNEEIDNDVFDLKKWSN